MPHVGFSFLWFYHLKVLKRIRTDPASIQSGTIKKDEHALNYRIYSKERRPRISTHSQLQCGAYSHLPIYLLLKQTFVTLRCPYAV